MQKSPKHFSSDGISTGTQPAQAAVGAATATQATVAAFSHHHHQNHNHQNNQYHNNNNHHHHHQFSASNLLIHSNIIQTDTTDLKYLHKKFKRVASATTTTASTTTTTTTHGDHPDLAKFHQEFPKQQQHQPLHQKQTTKRSSEEAATPASPTINIGTTYSSMPPNKSSEHLQFNGAITLQANRYGHITTSADKSHHSAEVISISEESLCSINQTKPTARKPIVSVAGVLGNYSTEKNLVTNLINNNNINNLYSNQDDVNFSGDNNRVKDTSWTMDRRLDDSPGGGGPLHVINSNAIKHRTGSACVSDYNLN